MDLEADCEKDNAAIVESESRSIADAEVDICNFVDKVTWLRNLTADCSFNDFDLECVN